MTEAKDKKEEKNTKQTAKANLPHLKPGLTVSVYQKIKEVNSKGEEKERTQVFEGIIIGIRKPNSPEGTFTIRKLSGEVGVEKIIPFSSPNILKIEIKKEAKVRRAKLNHLRSSKKKLKEKKIA